MTPPTPLSARYHEATKYSPEAIRRLSGVAPRRPPPPFKPWVQAQRIALPGRDADTAATGSLARDAAGDACTLDIEGLGRLLHHTYGVTRIQQMEGHALYLRAAPSAGGLYPTEIYVAVLDVQGVAPGLYAYHGADHALITCWEGDFAADLERFTYLTDGLRDAGAVLIGTGFYERSAWRYHDRAYRRVLLDAGHVFGNALIAAEPMGFGVTVMPDFIDDGFNNLLLLDPAQEATVLIALICAAPSTRVASQRRAKAPPPADMPEHGTWIPIVHGAGHLDDQAEMLPDPRPSDHGGEAAGGTRARVDLDDRPLRGGPSVLQAIRARRSTRHYVRGPVPMSALGRILAHGYRSRDGTGQHGTLAPGLLQTFLLVAGVHGLAEGAYGYDPEAHQLIPRDAGPVRTSLHRICLGQELGRDAAFAVVHCFDQAEAFARYGDRAYRLAHLEAGVIGQHLNLAAARLGFGASGIGGFFDDMANDRLGLDRDCAIAYITTVGVPG